MKTASRLPSEISEPNGVAYERLRERMAERPLALVGAGISAGLGYPAWGELLTSLHDKVAQLPERQRPAPKILNQMARIEDALWRAEEYRRLLGDEDFFGAVTERFKPRPVPPTSAAAALCGLSFSHFLTTNYDPSLESSEGLAVVNWSNASQVSRFLRSLANGFGDRSVVYLHGRYDDPTVILSEQDYLRRYVIESELTKRLFALFVLKPVVFVGFSMSDPELRQLLRIIRYQIDLDAAETQHFAFLPLTQQAEADGIEGPRRQEYRARYGVEPIFYRVVTSTSADGTTTDDHGQLTELLLALNGDGDGVLESERKPMKGAPVFAIDAVANVAPNPDDPRKGQFGGSPSANGRTLSASVDGSDGWFRIDLRVEPDPGAPPITGTVSFHLHDTFHPDVRDNEPVDGVATEELWAYGAFTVGVSIEGEPMTRLELDLAQLNDAPRLFRER